jgi:ElaB/YqjD/DUF883 family membrane-anchored ribosome-binding protein
MTTTTENSTATTSNSGAGNGRDGSGGPLSSARQSAAEAYEAARERTSAAYAAARDAARTASRRTGEGIESNPMAAVAGGLALGAIVAALLPRTEREEALFGDVGRKITGTAREAAAAAREAGKQQLDELGLSRDGLRSKLDEFTDRAVGAVKTSTGAAAGAVRGGGSGTA